MKKAVFKLLLLLISFIGITSGKAQNVLAFQGFENDNCDTWAFTGGNTSNEIARTGSMAARIGRQNESNTLTMNTLNVSGYAGLQLSLYHAVRSGTGPGMDTREGAVIMVSLNGGAFNAIGRVTGYGDTNWGFNSTGGTTTTSSGCDDYQCPNPLTYNIPAGTNTIQLKIVSVRTGACPGFNTAMTNGTAANYDRADEGFFVDDIRITTTSPLPIVRTSAAGTDAQTVCTGVNITNITYTIGGMGGATVTGLPAGINGSYNSSTNTFTISGAATVTGTFNYTVTANCTGATASGTITVNAKPVVAGITGANNVCVPNTITLSNTTPGGTWSSNNTSIASVDNNGLVTGIAAGTATIAYAITNTCGTTAQTQSITVNTKPVVASITGSATLCTGGTTTWSNATAGGVWSSDNTAVASVDNSGLITAIAIGTATISYTVTNTCGSTTQTQVITVSDKPIVASISGSNTVCAGSNITLSNTTPGGVWSSDNTAIGNINSTGVVTGVATGTATISYTVTNTCGSTAQTQSITVNDKPTVTSITGNSNVCVGSTVTLGNTTAGGVWASSNTGIATIDNNGIVTAIATGNTTISYTVTNTCGSTSATTTITVNDKPIVANITGNNTVCTGNTTSLSNTTTGGIWTTADNNIATVNNGTVTGIATGTTIISYTVTNTCGSTTVTQNITVNSQPNVAEITGNATVCLGDTTRFKSTTTGGVWSSSNNTIATISNGLITGNTIGNATISYTVTNTCGSTIKTRTITVINKPVVALITGANNTCVGNNINLSNITPGGTWSSDNTTVATVSNGVVTPVTAGTALITYTVTNSCGSTPTTHNVVVNDKPTVANVTGPASLCMGSNVTLSNSTPGGVWSSSDNTIATVNNGIVTPIATGTATIAYTVTNTCGSTTQTKLITVNDKPFVPAITGNTSVCIGNTVTLNNTIAGGVWSSGNIAIATVSNNGIVTPVATGTTNIVYTVTNTCGSTTQTHSITVGNKPAVNNITGANTLCAGNTITLNNTTPSGTWSTTDANLATVNNGFVTGIASGTVIISYTVTNTCGSSIATKTITVNDKPVVAGITGNAIICTGSTTTLSNSTTGGTWSSNNNAVASITNNGIVTGVTAGSATIAYTVTNTCGSTTVTQIVTTSNKPVLPAITGPTEMFVGNNIQLQNAYTGGVWSSSNSTAAPVSNTGVVTARISGVVTISYSISSPCGTVSVSHALTIKPQINDIFIPNVFSPNGDNRNDFFYVLGSVIESVDLSVFNQWGELVFESHSPAEKWNGMFKGKPAAVGVYVYVAKIKTTNGLLLDRKGSVNLVR